MRLLYLGLVFLAAGSAVAFQARLATQDPLKIPWQQLFDLSARRTKLRLELEFVEKQLAQLEKEQLAGFVRVATPTGSEYWESISDMVLHAKASQDMRAGELLLYHAPGIYRVKNERPALTTEGECWYFLPDREIRSGEEFTIVPDYEAQRQRGDRVGNPARDPRHPFRAEVQIPRRPAGK